MTPPACVTPGAAISPYLPSLSQLPIVQLLSPLLSAQLGLMTHQLTPLATHGQTSEASSLRGRGQWSVSHHEPRLQDNDDDGWALRELVSLGRAREGHFREGVYSQCSYSLRCWPGPGHMRCAVTTAQLRPGAGLASDEIWGDGPITGQLAINTQNGARGKE